MQFLLPARGAYGSRPTNYPLLRMNGESDQARNLAAWFPSSYGNSVRQLRDVAGNHSRMLFNSSSIADITYSAMDPYGAMLVPHINGPNYTEFLDPDFTGVASANATIAYWVYLPDTSRCGTFVKVGGGTSGFGLGFGNTQVNNNGNNIVGLYENVRFIGTGVSIGTGVHHLAMVLNNSGFPEMYLDGRSVYSDASGAPSATTSGLFLSYATGNSVAADGCGLFDARVYNRPLSAREIWALYAPATRWELYWVPSSRVFFSITAGGGGPTPGAGQFSLVGQGPSLGLRIGMPDEL